MSKKVYRTSQLKAPIKCSVRNVSPGVRIVRPVSGEVQESLSEILEKTEIPQSEDGGIVLE